MRKAIIVCAGICMAIILSACGAQYEMGDAQPQPQPGRENYIQTDTGKAYDITSVVDFIDNMNENLDADNQIKNYDTTYDSESNTVYVSTKDSTIAFKMDDDNSVLFASCTGDADTKATLGKSIATTIMYGDDSPVEQLFNQIEETRWLNSINSNVIEQKLNSGFNTSLDTDLPDWSIDTSGELDTTISMPTFTQELKQAGLKDLSDYFESPTLPEFWSGIDEDDMLTEMEQYEENGETFKTITMPDTSIETPDLTGLLSDEVKEALLQNELEQETTSDIDSSTGAVGSLETPELPEVETVEPSLPSLTTNDE